MIRIIAAIGTNRAIGKNNQLLWNIPDDLRRFKQLTTGHPCIMGSKTFDSIVAIIGKPLPGRANIVMNPVTDWCHEGALRAGSLKEAISIANTQQGAEDIFIIGGGQIYTIALPFADVLHLTMIDDTQVGDTYFPAYEQIFKTKLSEENRELNGLKYSWMDLGK